jgi:N-acetylglutamate synthase-like GNAT family acetyltransferase
VDSITIRKATTSDSQRISELISRNAQSLLQDDFENDGLDFFLNTVNHRAIKDYMEQGFPYLVAQSDKNIVGVIAMKDCSHMFHLFVDKAYHKKGIAKKLWQAIFDHSLKNGNSGVFTLNSTSYALPVYERWGFSTTDKEQSRHGIRYTPMKFVVST